MKIVFQTLSYLAVVTFLVLVLSSVFLRVDFLESIIAIWFFRIIIYILTSALILTIASFILLKVAAIGIFHVVGKGVIVCSFFISFFFVYNFLSVTAFTNQRSYTIFSLADLYENSDKIYTQEDIEQVFINKFILEGGASKQRIDEQLATGYIEQVDGGYRISNSGKTFIELLRFLDRFFPVPTNPSSLYPYGK